MSMTVAQRKREFGIRLALGGSAGGVMMTVARRALIQIAAGVAWGAGLWVAVMAWALAGNPGGEVEDALAGWPYILATAAAVVITIALAASLGPTLRYVRMRPVETLRVDG
jgi:ABC-type antimicrobial peptide transport system permease subunit